MTFGFDLNIGKYEHFYGEGKGINCFPPEGESEQIIEASYDFYDWCISNGIDMSIVSHLNQFDDRFVRKTLESL